jgi:hypothetical protein
MRCITCGVGAVHAPLRLWFQACLAHRTCLRITQMKDNEVAVQGIMSFEGLKEMIDIGRNIEESLSP